MQSPLLAEHKDYSARTITGPVTGLQPSWRLVVTPPDLAKDAGDFCWRAGQRRLLPVSASA